MWDSHRGRDLLVPFPYDMTHPLYSFPWEKKIRKAAFRGASFCHMINMRCAAGSLCAADYA